MPSPSRRTTLTALAAAGSRLALPGLGLVGTAAHAQSALPTRALKPVTVARGLENPWGLAFLPDGQWLVTERPGQMRRIDREGRLGSPLKGLPRIDVGGQGGLLDVVLGPRFKEDARVYFAYSEPAPSERPGGAGAGRGNSTAVAYGRLEVDRLSDVTVIFRQAPKFSSGAHFGSRLVFTPLGDLFITLGDRFQRRDDAQTLDNHHGKVVRVRADGSVPPDNPFVGRAGARPEIWSYGHRNVQGAALHPETGELWTHEHGPQGGDEVNVTLAGRNYGWPVITYGAEYGSGRKIGEGTARAGIEAPVTHWVPSIAPSGMAFLTSDRYGDAWKGNLFVGALSGRLLARLQLDGRRVVREERLLTDLGERIRDVRQGPDGWLYLLTDSGDGRVIRLETA